MQPEKSCNMQTELRLVHFNDVYHIPSERLFSRFCTLIDNFRKESNSLTVFGGDVFSPSLEASVLKGEQMLPILNYLRIDVGCYGNHDFDFGNQRLVDLSNQLQFPSVLSNAFHSADGGHGSQSLLGAAREYVTHTIGGLRLGFFGLAGTDWPSNCENLPPSRIVDPVSVAKKLARFLRREENCDVVIAITHMRLPEDMEVANATASGEERVDLILGGHDHEVVRRFAGDTSTKAGVVQQGYANSEIIRNGVVSDAEGSIRVVKSGTDWKGLSLLRLIVHNNEDGKVRISTIKLKQYEDLDMMESPESALPPQEIVDMLASIHKRVGDLVQKPLLHTAVPLEGRNSLVRSQETNLGNLLADAVRAFYDTDMAFFNSGAMRCDRVLSRTVSGGAPLLVRDMINICPFENPMLVKRLSGAIIHHALENSISDKHTDGRFLQVSGLRVIASWEKEEGNRILEVFPSRPGAQPERIDPCKTYTVAMSAFIASGFDGYTWFPEQETVIDIESAISDTSLMLMAFGYTNEMDSKPDANHGLGIARARKAVIAEMNAADGFPVVQPSVDGRIHFL
ncbi:Metallo-dependent phosphatase-like protein [Aspergillus avenaceus]|uniref:Metallo-dependent phosphatase-like protein n=1 Tax=Aspergillus avenaceus TaxID=36643 RepID=A0A5N6U8E5_ASPAV|nr:Metallo-dependent phosphatase-like protein [Aspergillus avenaceus]